jgi:hypothetical protein
MFSERKMGTLARLMASKSVKSDQPTIKATSPYASGYDKNHNRVVALDASSAFCFSRYRMFSECRMGTPARSVAQIGQECPIYWNAKSSHAEGGGLLDRSIRSFNMTRPHQHSNEFRRVLPF